MSRPAVILDALFLRGRFARRVFGLFVAAALLPIAVLVLVSYRQIGDLVERQARTALSDVSRAYGMSLYERLLAADSLLQAAALETEAGGRDDFRTAYTATFASVQFRNAAEPVDSVAPVNPLRNLASPLSQRLARGDPVFRVLWIEGRPRMFLMRLARRNGVAGFLIGELLAEPVWGNRDSLPYATDVAVLDADGALLYATAALDDTARERLSRDAALRSSGLISIRVHDADHLATFWTLFLQSNFGAPAYTIVSTQPESVAYSPLRAFQSTFAKVIAVTALAIVLLSVFQIRRRVRPLAELIVGTERVARRDFSTRIAVDSGDEFEDLGRAFNTMISDLGQQFAEMSTMAEIDRQILLNMDFERVATMVVERAPGFVHCDLAGVLAISERRGNTRGILITSQVSDGRAKSVERRDLTTAEIVEAKAHPGDGAIGADDRWPAFCRTISREHIARIALFPIDWNDRRIGFLLLGRVEDRAFAADEVRRVEALADRIGVALASAAREEQLYRNAHFDPLTGLPNRLLFRDRLTQEIARAQRDHESLALLYIDLDHFKEVNDALGHSAGDHLLRQVATRVGACIRESDTVARIGGDEFTVLLAGVQSAHDAGSVAEAVVRALSQPFQLPTQEVFVTASLGVAIFPFDATDADDLFKNADLAMYRAKSAGRNRQVFFEEKMNREAEQRVATQRDLHRALERNEFLLYYQPQMDLATSDIVGAEALLRWRHPERGVLAPGEFVDVAEETGLITRIGFWVVDEVCRQLGAWRAQGMDPPRVAINVSARQFRDSTFSEAVRYATQRWGVPPNCLEFEITESLLIEDFENVTRILADLRSLGTAIAIDDFGTRYSSLAYLKRLPYDYIKIDRSFVNEISRDTESASLVKAIISIAHTLGKKVIAEGVETGTQKEFLRHHGCDFLQGYLLSRPLPPAEYLGFVMSRRVLKSTAERARRLVER